MIELRRMHVSGIRVFSYGLLGLIFGVATVACDDDKEAKRSPRDREETAKEQPVQQKSEPEEAPNEKFARRHREAVELMRSAVDAAVGHFEGGADMANASFPGGTGVEFRTRETPPREGTTYQYGVSAGAAEGAVTEAAGTGDAGDAEGSGTSVAAQLGIESGQELPAQLVYRTSDEAGEEAHAIFELFIDFDPDDEANHRLSQELTVDPKSGEVNVFPRLVHHRWK